MDDLGEIGRILMAARRPEPAPAPAVCELNPVGDAAMAKLADSMARAGHDADAIRWRQCNAKLNHCLMFEPTSFGAPDDAVDQCVTVRADDPWIKAREKEALEKEAERIRNGPTFANQFYKWLDRLQADGIDPPPEPPSPVPEPPAPVPEAMPGSPAVPDVSGAYEAKEFGKDFDTKAGFEIYVELLRAGFWDQYDFVPGCILPGYSGARKSCGNWMVKGCKGPQDKLDVMDHAHAALHEKSGTGMIKKVVIGCGRMGCEICFEKGINMAAARGAERLEAYMLLLRSNLFPRKKSIYNHFVVSCAREKHELLKSADFRKKHEAEMLAQLKGMGIRGGVMIFHPYRFKRKGAADDVGAAYWSPHYHFILAGYTEAAAVVAAHKKTGDVYKSIRTFQDGKQAYNVMRYLLTHASVAAKKHTVRYFGDCNNRKFSTKAVLASGETERDAARLYDDIHGGKILPSLQKRGDLRLVSIEAQRFEYKGLRDMRGDLIRSLADLADPGPVHEVTDRDAFLRAITRDNAPNTKSDRIEGEAEGHAPKTAENEGAVLLLRATYDYRPPNSEKCSRRTKPLAVFLGQTVDVCEVCRRRLRHILPDSTDTVPAFDDERDQTPIYDPDHWHYFDRLQDTAEGLPYFLPGGTQRHYDAGEIMMHSRLGQITSDLIKRENYESRINSFPKVFRKEVRSMGPVSKEDVQAYVADRMKGVRKAVAAEFFGGRQDVLEKYSK